MENLRDSPTGERISGNWKQFKGKVREKWGALTDDELDRVKGQRDQLLGVIEKRSGEARANIEREVDRLAHDVDYKF